MKESRILTSQGFPSLVYPPRSPFSLLIDTNAILLPNRNAFTHRAWPGFSFIPFCMVFLGSEWTPLLPPHPATPLHAVNMFGALGFSGDYISTEAVVCNCLGRQRDMLMRHIMGRASHAGSGGWEELTEELRLQCESRQVNRSSADGQGENQCKAEETACAEMWRHEKASPCFPVLFLIHML